MEEDNNRYFDWLKHEIEYRGRYHDHKEQMAWLGTAFYLVGILSLAFAARSEHFCSAGQWCITAFFIVATLVFTCFINWQFEKRWDAYLRVLAFNPAMRRILAGGELQPQERELRALQHPPPDEPLWPSFVAEQLDEQLRQGRGQRRWTRFLIIPTFVLRRAAPLQSESITYGAVYLAFIAAVTLIWWT
jgi:hypothetical protein